jgi:hypothetical protein
VIDRLGTMTLQRCHASAQDGLGCELTDESMLLLLAFMSRGLTEFKASFRAERRDRKIWPNE